MATKKNGLTVGKRPAADTKTGRVWDTADAITRENGRAATCREVRERYTAEGGNPNTANTQYSRWKADYDNGAASHAPERPVASGDVRRRRLKVAPDGRLLIPADMREAMQLREGGSVIVRVEAGELRVVDLQVSIRQVQARMRKYKRPGVSEVDSFLAERRAMWGEE